MKKIVAAFMFIILVSCSSTQQIKQEEKDLNSKIYALQMKKTDELRIKVEEGFKTVDGSLETYNETGDRFSLSLAHDVNADTHQYVAKWLKEAALAVLGNQKRLGTQGTETVIEVLNVTHDAYLNKVCINYNIIANHLATAGEINNAQGTYKHVLRTFDDEDFKGCFTEAEISLRALLR